MIATTTTQLRGPARDQAIARAWELKSAGWQYAEIASKMGLRTTQMPGLMRDARKRYANGSQTPKRQPAQEARSDVSAKRAQEPTALDVGVSTYTYTGAEQESIELPRLDGEPHLHGNCIVVGDVHLPTTDFKLAGLVLSTARALGIRTLAIVGDLMNMDAFSRYEHLIPPPPFQKEIAPAVRLIERWSEWFERIIMVMGNHEHRLLKRNNGHISATWLGRILSASRGKLEVSPYGHVIIHCGGEVWRATHQRNYSRIKGRVGNQLAQKYQCNIITLHQHHVSKIRDDFNRYTIIDGGGLFDDELMAYVKLTDSTMPSMARGFTVLYDGTGHLVTPYQSYTDLDVLLAGLADKNINAPSMARGG